MELGSVRLLGNDLWTERLASKSEAGLVLGELVERAQLSHEGLHLALKLPLAPADPSGLTRPINLPLARLVPMQMKRRGVEMRIVLEGDSTPNRVDLPLLKAVARGRKWSRDLLEGRVPSVRAIARREGLAARYVRELVPLGLLAIVGNCVWRTIA